MAVVPSEGSRRGFGVSIPGADRMVWYFFRISGIALVVLALGHLFITHYANVPSETTFDFVSKRWANPLWRSFDWMLLLFALWHGMLGLRISINDYIRRDGVRLIASSANWLVAVVITIIGTMTIITFDEEMSRTNSGPLSGEMWIADVLGYSLLVISIVTYVAVAIALIWIVRNLLQGQVPIYNGDTGQYAWLFHRMTGIGVLFFLLVHVIDIMLIGLGRDVYDHAVSFYGNGLGRYGRGWYGRGDRDFYRAIWGRGGFELGYEIAPWSNLALTFSPVVHNDFHFSPYFFQFVQTFGPAIRLYINQHVVLYFEPGFLGWNIWTDGDNAGAWFSARGGVGFAYKF